VAFAPDGKTLANRSVKLWDTVTGREAPIWDVATGQVVRTLTHGGLCSPGRHRYPGREVLLTGGYERTVRV
jgi:hypothetical protein